MKKVVFSCAVILACLLSSQAAWAQSPPSLPLKDSLQVAEEMLGKAKVNLSQYFLYSVIYTNSSKGPFWYCTFKPAAPGSREIFVKVYMDKSVEIIGASAGGR